jgi:FkbM family methyltransferase
MTFASQVAHYLQAFQRLGNPFHVLYKRAFAKPDEIMTVQDRASGIRCRCTVGSYGMFGGTWYSHEYDVPHVPIREGDTVLDIGANQGFFTCYAAHRGARVYAFEPNPECYERLVSNLELNGLTDRVVARPWAISDKNGQAELLVSNELGGGMSTINPEFARNYNVSIRRKLEVPMYALPQVLESFSLSHIRFCKMDAEGSELAILRTLEASQLAMIDSFAVEIHTGGSPLQDLAEVILGWETHQIGFNDEREFSAPIMRLIANRVLTDGTRTS